LHSHYCSIYLFGGGQSSKRKFNDIIQLKLPDYGSKNDFGKLTLIGRSVNLANNIGESGPLEPSRRTYHAATLLKRFMVVIGGESNQSGDLNDLWTFDLEARVWY
jgi:hypothetical protein